FSSLPMTDSRWTCTELQPKDWCRLPSILAVNDASSTSPRVRITGDPRAPGRDVG
ncbi:hypothetical protein XENOCAPTIV_021708, partial [Xenoophorus captivus]